VSIPFEEYHHKTIAAYQAVHDALGDHGTEVPSAGRLAAIMSRLPADTPVILANVARIDLRLDEDSDRRTTVVAEFAQVEEPEDVQVDLGDGIEEYPQLTPVVQIGAYVTGRNTGVTPHMTVPLPAQQRAEEAQIEGDLEPILAAYMELLITMAMTLTASPVHDSVGDAHLEWIDDADLRREIADESDRLFRAAQRLGALHTRVAQYERAAAVICEAEELIKRSAEDPGPTSIEDTDQ